MRLPWKRKMIQPLRIVDVALLDTSQIQVDETVVDLGDRQHGEFRDAIANEIARLYAQAQG